MANTFSSFLIGEGTLLVQCAEVLLSQGHTIDGILSSELSIKHWSKERGVPFSDPADNDIVTVLKQHPFDYLFSIVNPHILSQEILALPQKGAINYHDAPLPKYAGMHATSWALMQGESHYGISWHSMTKDVDAGDIYIQPLIEIEDDETAFTLNVKCYEAAIQSFTELVSEINSGRVRLFKQDLSKRTFFSRNKRPSGGCVLSWDQSVHQIGAFVRALSYGPYPNELGLPKINIGREFFLVPEIDVSDSIINTSPGIISGIDEHSLTISALDGHVRISRLLTVDGDPLSISQFVRHFGLYEGYRLEKISQDIGRHITSYTTKICQHESFWVERLAKLRKPTIPHLKQKKSIVKDDGFLDTKLSLPGEVLNILKNPPENWQGTRFLVVAFIAYIARICNMQNFDIGFKDSDLQRELPVLNGLFAEVIPLHVEANDNQGFTEFYAKMQSEIVRTKLHRTYARDIKVRYSDLLSLAKVAEANLLGVVVEQVERIEDYEYAQGSDLHFIVTRDQTECRLIYHADEIEENAISSIGAQFTAFLQGLVADIVSHIEQPLGDVSLLTDVEQERILSEWNATARPYPPEQSLPQLFEAQVARCPDAVALACAGQQVTYEELNGRANQLAHLLRELGVGPEVRVGLCLPRSVELLIGLLAILKAGGAYVPLDPTYPQERLDFMIQDSQLAVLLSYSPLRKGEHCHSVKTISLDQEWAVLTRRSRAKLGMRSHVEQLAYIIYTSGSLGQPKGVQIAHKGLPSLAMFQAQAVHSRPGMRVLQLASFSFDASLWDVLMAFYAGGVLCVATEEARLPGQELVYLLEEQGITHATLTPAVLAALPEAGFPMLEVIMSTGEAVTAEVVARWAPGRLFLNGYGPTETTVGASSGECRIGEAKPSIGRPIANTQIYLLDARAHLVPIGVPGEIYIGGAGLARGYLNRAEVTAERFVPDPFCQEPGGRLYRTGDLGRYRADGQVEYLGRIDLQVKVRGFRIELGEIETVLREHVGVREVVVVAREEEEGEKRLVAYVVESGLGPKMQSEQWQQYVQQRLPQQMVPAAFVMLEALPLTPNGKVDRRALPAPEGQRPTLESGYIAPTTPTQELLVGIWQQVLRLEQVGIHDNFFALGGHSLLATQILVRIRHVLQVDLPLRCLFEVPTIFGFAQQVEDAQRIGVDRPEKEVFLRSRLESGKVPLSFAQQRLWFLDQWEPESPLYNVPFAVQLDGLLSFSALAHSLQRIVERHEVLRTTFSNEQGLPLQVIAPALRLDLPLIDLSALPSSVSWPLARHLAAQEAVRPFDLERGPLLRVRLLRVASQEHVLLLSLHHIITDGWSTGILLHELSSLYQATVEQRPDPLPTLAVQYADYALWQREWLQGEVLERQLGYWRQHLAHLPVLDLPTDHPRPPLQSHRGATQAFLFPLRLLEGLRELSQQEGVTLFMTLLASFQCLLARYSGQDDIAVGTPIANRSRPELETLIGCFLNTLVLRTDLSGNPSFQQVLRRVREGCLGAYAHQDLPFERLVEELEPKRDLSRPPLVQVVLVLQNAPGSDLPLPGLRLRSLEREGEHETAKFDLTLNVSESSQGLQGSLEYATELFEAETIKRLLGHLRTLLEGVVAHPEQRIGELPLLTQEEQILLSQQWNATEGPFPEQQSLSQCFEEQVARTPEAVALVYEEQQVTYEELDRRANQLAHALHTLGVGPEVRVGLCLPRSVTMLIGLLAILKAGGAYVPLDPDAPGERLAFLIQDSQLALVLGQARFASELPLLAPLLVSLDSWEFLAHEPASPLPCEPHPAQSAYVIYTSGSTGTPKGVLVAHGNVLRLFESSRSHFGFHEHDVWTLAHSITFDFSVWEVWGALLFGGRLVLVPSLVSRAPEDLFRLLSVQGVSVLNQTPSAFQHLAQVAAQKEERLALRYVIFGGEALDVQILDPWWQKYGAQSPQLVNMYGITETTVHVTHQVIEEMAQPSGRGSRIGGPLSDLQVYVVDPWLRVVPVGVPGEVYIGGAGLARGYLNRAELTAERFVPDPFRQEPGARLYRSGDRARWLADGTLEYLGRLDDQVKVRGFRIELGEVEVVLGRHPEVEAVVVMVREEVVGEKRLVAYLVPHSGRPAPTVASLRAYGQQQLPEYMIPSTFVVLEELPLTPNGKVDRRALPAPQGQRPTLESGYVAASTPTQELLVGIWQQVLRLEEVGIHDNFFALGGHSLLVIQMIARISSSLAISLPIRNVFENPTIAVLAQQIEAMQRNEQTSQIPRIPLAQYSRDRELSLSFAQQRLWFLDQWEPDSPLYNIPATFRLQGNISPGAFKQSLEKIVQRHEVLRTTFFSRNGKPGQKITPYYEICLPLIDLTGLLIHERETVALSLADEEIKTPFDLVRGPLLRSTLLYITAREQILLFTLHHIIADGWSLEILLEELHAFYADATSGAPAQLPELSLQYVDYALWQREWLQGEVLEQQLRYWRQHLVHLPVLNLPTDHPRPSIQSHRGATHSLLLPYTLQAALKQWSQIEGVTLFMTLLTAFQTLLAYWSGQDDIVIGTPVTNRPLPALEKLIGCFTNTLVLRADLSGNPSFREAIRRVQEVCLGAYAHQDVPFERLVQEIQPGRSVNHLPLFQVWFVLQEKPLTPIVLPDLTILPMSRERSMARYDLKLEAAQCADGLSLVFEYDTDLFEATTINRVLQLFATLLYTIVDHSDFTFSKLMALLAEGEVALQLQQEKELAAYSMRTLKRASRKGQVLSHE